MIRKLAPFIIFVFLATPLTISAQTSLDVPDDTPNTRYYSDVFNIERPALSIVGFDNGGDHSKGYGLKQILEKLYNNSAEQQTIDTFNSIVLKANEDTEDPFSTGGISPLTLVNNNSNILQNRAFVALARYVLYQNGITAQIPGATQTAAAYNVAIADLKNGLLKSSDWLLANSNHSSDQVKWTRTVGNYARALDLYLALENAFAYYGEPINDSRLLSQTQKKLVLSRLFERMNTISDYLYSDAVDPLSGVQNYEAEPGNRPMKMFMAVGYGALGMQSFLYDMDGPRNEQFTGPASQSMLSDAFRSGGSQEPQNSIKYWSYQTNNGKRFWAEGPYYFEFSLNDVIPFWHAIRANGLLQYSNFDIADPFKHGWFLRPLNWLADLATPEGDLPPIDDGNKRSIRYSNLLKWAPVYSTSSDPVKPAGNTLLNNKVGKKFAWIFAHMSGGSDPHTSIVDLAIPNASVPASNPLPTMVGNTESNITGNNAEQQVVLRVPDSEGKTHYLFLNGESGDAILRGEGHEQADQLQILYYYDGNSYLMDSGYDHSGSSSNSTWNKYKLHNVQFMGDAPDGGLPAPYIDIDKGRKISEHNDVSSISVEKKGKIYSVEGIINLQSTYGIDTRYKRNILFICNDGDPYLIDINENLNPVNIDPELLDYHYVGLNYFMDTIDNPLISDWDNFKKFEFNNKDIFITIDPVEWNKSASFVIDDIVKLREESGRDMLGDQDGYEVRKIGLVKDNSINSRSWSSVSFLKLDNAIPQYNPQDIFPYNPSNNMRPFQGWAWKVKNDVIDIIVKRAYPDYEPTYSLDIELPAQINDQIVPRLVLPANMGYGFARLVKTTNGWEINSDYRLNLTESVPLTVMNGNSITANTTWDGIVHLTGDTYIDNNATLTVDPGTEIYLDPGVMLRIRPGSKILAEGTTSAPIKFLRADPDQAWERVDLRSSAGNRFAWCLFDGGNKNVDILSTNNTFDHCTFKNGWRGISSGHDVDGSGNSAATITHSIIRNNTSVGVVAYYSNMDMSYTTIRDNTQTGMWVSSSTIDPFHHNVVENNGTTTNGRDGLEILSSGTLFMRVSSTGDSYNRVAYNKGDQIFAEGIFSMMPPESGMGGRNAVVGTYSTGGPYLINNQSGSSIYANDTYWGGTPEPAMFNGTVVTDGYLAYDPTSGSGASGVPNAVQDPEGPVTVAGTAAVAEEVETSTPSVTGDMDRFDAWYASLLDAKSTTDMYNFYTQLYRWALLSNDEQVKDRFIRLLLANSSAATHFFQSEEADSYFRQLSVLMSLKWWVGHGEYELAEDRLSRVEYEALDAQLRAEAYTLSISAHVATGHYAKAGEALKAYYKVQTQRGMDMEKLRARYAIIEEEIQGRSGQKIASNQQLAQEVQAEQRAPDQVTISSYPNPFNPTTTFTVEVPRDGVVQLYVYNLLGRKVATLHEGALKAGRHTFRFDGSGLASGTYFYRMMAGVEVRTGNITLMK